jgi:hypothetical protein
VSVILDPGDSHWLTITDILGNIDSHFCGDAVGVDDTTVGGASPFFYYWSSLLIKKESVIKFIK